MSRVSSRRYRHSHGLTLVEVVAGLALLASLAVGVLLSIGAHRIQTQQAHNRLAAADLADQLLAGWYSSSRGIPRYNSGLLSADGNWFWQTRVVDRRFIGTFTVEVIRLQVSKRSTRETPLVTIDVLAPGPQPVGAPQL